MKKNRNLFYQLLFAASFLLPFVFAITTLYIGTIPFWYDPARDLMMALETHNKISLIGQTSGIPGIFYGPYWVWSLSLALYISHDPRIITFLVLTLPYFILFPVLLFKFKKLLGNVIPLLLWLLFILAFGQYATQLWNPHHAPILILLTIYLLTSQDFSATKWRKYLYILGAGFSAGFLMNTHISFGLVVVIGSYFYLLLSKNRIKSLSLFTAGLIFTFLPFFVFEIRHGFNQVRTILETITSSSAVVKETSVVKLQIVNLFFNHFARLLQIPGQLVYLLIGLIGSYLLILHKKKNITWKPEEKKVLLLLGTITAAMFAIYLGTKNPVWEYHFIGTEILFLLIIGIVARKNTVFKYILLCWVLILLLMGTIKFVKELRIDPHKTPSLITKEYIVETIYKDAGGKTFAVHAFSPAKFTPELDYIFLWKGEGKNSAILNDAGNAELVYLVIPWTTKDLKADFIDNKTPHKRYKTVNSWHIADETDIIKRVRDEKK